MSLENLLKTKQLQPHNPSREAVQRLLQAAARNIADARIAEISGETRFDAAYKAITALNWKPGVTFEQGLRAAYEDYLKTLETGVARL